MHDDIDATSDRDEHHPQPGSTQAKPETSTGSEKLRETAKRAMAKYDHKDLSTIFEVPSCENVCLGLFKDIQKELPRLQSVRLWEGHNKWAEASVQDASLSKEPMLAIGSTR